MGSRFHFSLHFKIVLVSDDSGPFTFDRGLVSSRLHFALHFKIVVVFDDGGPFADHEVV